MFPSTAGHPVQQPLCLPVSSEQGPPHPVDAPDCLANWAFASPATAGAARFAVTFTRTRLALTAWAGDLDIAATAVKELMLNAAHHVGTGEVSLILTVSEDQDLIIQVVDEDPHFKGFDEATAAMEPTGLHRIRALGGEITWGLLEQGGKAVQVRLHAASQ
uniref:hypothetical protein n=1 Tax=Streptomyces chartreusis TaxID=1969 RepID=UPI003F4905CA